MVGRKFIILLLTHYILNVTGVYAQSADYTGFTNRVSFNLVLYPIQIITVNATQGKVDTTQSEMNITQNEVNTTQIEVDSKQQLKENYNTEVSNKEANHINTLFSTDCFEVNVQSDEVHFVNSATSNTLITYSIVTK